MIIDKFNFPIYPIIILLSFIIGMIFNFIFLSKSKIEKRKIIVFLTMLITYSLFFAVLFTVMVSNEFGISSYGGAIGILIAAIIYTKIQDWDFVYIKSSVLSLPLFYSTSKLACFFTRLLPWYSLHRIFKCDLSSQIKYSGISHTII